MNRNPSAAYLGTPGDGDEVDEVTDELLAQLTSVSLTEFADGKCSTAAEIK